MRKKVNWNKWWEYWSNFQPKQLEAQKAVDKYGYVFYGGSAGPGKSYFLRKYPIKFLIETWNKTGIKGIRAGLFCEDYPALHDRHLSKIPYEFPSYLGTYKAQQHEFILHEHLGGGVIAFRNLDDPSKYLSSEFALIEVDELTKNKKETFDFLRLRKRWPGIEHTKFVGASNPGGVGHDWVKQLWINNVFAPEEVEQKEFKFIKALPQDNKYLPESYYQTLSSLPEKLRKAYRDGNWDVFEGQYFSEWDNERHTVSPFKIPENYKRFRAYDHGRENPASCGWYALDYDGRIFKYREFYQKGLDVDQIANEINRLSTTYDATGKLVPEIYEYSVADPSIFANIGYTDKYGGQTIAETFARNGIMFIPASNRRVDGWNLMHQYLRWTEHQKPKLQFFSTCKDSIRTIPSLIHDEHRPEDVETKSEDHAGDECRYLLMSIHEGKSTKPMNDTEKKLQQMKQQIENPLAKFEL